MFKIFTQYISFFFICISNFLLPVGKNIECCICESTINEQKYLVDIWGNPFHIHHKSNGQFCECCARIISKKMKSRRFSVNEEVEARYEGGHNWHDAKIVGHKEGSSHYEIEFKSG